MIGNRVKELRNRRGWTQIHLAEAAEISLRTIQRMEALHSHSAETLLAVAAAFGVDARDLTAPSLATSPEQRPLWPAVEPRTAGLLALVLGAPAAIFVALNLLKFGGGYGSPFDTLAAVGSVLGSTALFDRAGPLLMMAAPLIALALVIAACVRPYGCVEGHSVTLTGVELRWDLIAFTAGLMTLTTLAALVAYAILENLIPAVRVAG